MKQKKLAIIYDWIDSRGGAERLLRVFAEMYPEADWYSLVHDPKKASWSKTLHVKTSFINKLPLFIKQNRKLIVPFMPFAIESFNLTKYSHVLSVTSAFAKAVITRPETTHISYVLSPPRFLWSHQKEYATSSPIMRPYINYLKNWDYIAARRPDKLIAISPEIATRIKRYYNLEADIIMPPFDYEYWRNLIDKRVSSDTQNNPYLMVSRLVHYKRVDLVIEAFKRMPSRRLTIVGDGALYNKLSHDAPTNITFKHNLSDKELATQYSSAKALIMPQREDFGYVALEAQACGCPVIAYKKGGVQSTILENETGIFIESQNIEALQKALDKFEEVEYTIRHSLEEKATNHLAQFSIDTFTKKFNKLIVE